ncbi:hypothetical protein [Micromonospora sp. RTGN7]|uniref:hypothetical protein n=1 Tax=Micromonospora sp. RTGN7 TaxID=3016526 RepID=UPI0029FEDFBA|nr:hypothetical protein [Micromonospora sp. RTGN7]
MKIARDRVVEALRGRDQHARADWVELSLPEWMESEKHVGLLATLRLDPAELVDAPSP